MKARKKATLLWKDGRKERQEIQQARKKGYTAIQLQWTDEKETEPTTKNKTTKNQQNETGIRSRPIDEDREGQKRL